MNEVQAEIALPIPGEIWRSGAPHHLRVRVLHVDLAASTPTVEYEVLDLDGSTLSGPLTVALDHSWHACFGRTPAAA